MIDNTEPNKFNEHSPDRPERKQYPNQTQSADTVHSDRKLYFGLSILQWLYLVGFCAATAITWAVSLNIAQFQHHGPLAFRDGFPGDIEQWSRRGGWENIQIEQDSIKVTREVDKASYAFRTFSLPPSSNRTHEKLKISGKVDTITMKPVTDTSDGGALMIWLQDDNDQVVKYFNVGKLDGLSDSYEVSRIVNLTDNITHFSLVLTNKQTSAEFSLVDASVSLLTEQPTFVQARIAIFLLWSAVFLITLYYLLTHASKAMFVVITGVLSLTIVGVLMPETVSTGTVKPLYAALQNMTGLTGDTVLEYAYKFGHFVFFFLSTLILLLYHKKLQLPAWEVYLLLIVFAVATEGIQLYLSDRTSRISDLLIDFSAIFIGAMLAIVIIMIRTTQQAKPNQQP